MNTIEMARLLIALSRSAGEEEEGTSPRVALGDV